jgi:hypothetical protein
MQPSEVSTFAQNVIERTKKVAFPILHIAPHYIRRTMPSAVSGCHVFIIAGPEPLSHNPKAPHLVLLACRQAASLMLSARLSVEVHPVRVDTTSVYTSARLVACACADFVVPLCLC